MKTTSPCNSSLAALLLIGFTSGCRRIPSLNVEGSFLPSWMLCLALGSVVGLLVRRAILKARIEHRVSPSVIFYPSLVIGISCAFWLIFFR